MKKILLLLAILISFSCFGQKKVINFKISQNKVEYTYVKDTFYDNNVWEKMGTTYELVTYKNNKSTIINTKTDNISSINDIFLRIKKDYTNIVKIIYDNDNVIVIFNDNTEVYSITDFQKKYQILISDIINKLQ